MDTPLRDAAGDRVTARPLARLAGAGAIVLDRKAVARACDSTAYLPVKKNRKFMGLQDEMAVVAAGRALESAGLAGRALGERTGLYLAVGYIPFEQVDVDALATGSTDEGGRFAMRLFSTTGVRAVKPLLTFRCLPNMPAYHVSACFDLQGPYLVTYPGVGQLYTALEEAVADLADGRVDRALVGGVADQRNFLVTHHFSRVTPPVPGERLADAAAFLVLERPDARAMPGAPERAALTREDGHADTGLGTRAGGGTGDDARGCLDSSRGSSLASAAQGVPPGARPMGLLCELEVSHALADPLGAGEAHERPDAALCALGPASLPAAVASRVAGGAGPLIHAVRTRDGFTARSVWEIG